MFVAMNRFQVRRGQEDAFEKIWLSRDSHLEKVPGFVQFDLLKGPETEEYTLYASHSTWANRDAFEAWTRSEEFRAAHKGARPNTDIYIGGPKLELFDSIQKVKAQS
ncbi:MAG: antibiotic biosynthesis monooxygenase [Caulobacterales bacterium]